MSWRHSQPDYASAVQPAPQEDHAAWREYPSGHSKAINGGETVFSIDSKPVKVCQNARAKRCQMGKDDIEHAPAWVYCASQNMYYYGSLLSG